MKKPKIKETPELDAFAKTMKRILFKCSVIAKAVHLPTRKVVAKVTVLSINNDCICGIWVRNLATDEWGLVNYALPEDAEVIFYDTVDRMGDDVRLEDYIAQKVINEEKGMIKNN